MFVAATAAARDVRLDAGWAAPARRVRLPLAMVYSKTRAAEETENNPGNRYEIRAGLARTRPALCTANDFRCQTDSPAVGLSGLCAATRRRLLELLELAIEVPLADAEHARGVLSVATAVVEHALDVAHLEFFERRPFARARLGLTFSSSRTLPGHE